MKNYLVFLSGGFDSTAALLKIFKEYRYKSIDVVHLVLNNAENRWLYEKNSCNKIIDWFKQYYSFNYYEYEFQCDGADPYDTEVVGIYASLFVRKNLFYYDYIVNGTCKSDDNYAAYTRDTKRHCFYYTGLTTHNPFSIIERNLEMPVWSYPIIEMTKNEVISYLRDSNFPIEYCVTCRNPINQQTPCGKCKACKEVIECGFPQYFKDKIL